MDQLNIPNMIISFCPHFPIYFSNLDTAGNLWLSRLWHMENARLYWHHFQHFHLFLSFTDTCIWFLKNVNCAGKFKMESKSHPSPKAPAFSAIEPSVSFKKIVVTHLLKNSDKCSHSTLHPQSDCPFHETVSWRHFHVCTTSCLLWLHSAPWPAVLYLDQSLNHGSSFSQHELCYSEQPCGMPYLVYLE